MWGKTGFARIAGAVTLGGAFYTATYITSYPNGAPAYAVLGLLAGTVGGILACALPRSSTTLTIAAVLVGFAFTGAVIHSGMGFLPGFVLMIIAARRGAQPDAFAFLDERAQAEERSVARHNGNAGGFAWMRLEQGDASAIVTVPEAEDVVTVPEADTVVTLPEAETVVTLPEAETVVTLPEADISRVSSDGLVQAGPPGVIGLLAHAPKPRPQTEGFR